MLIKQAREKASRIIDTNLIESRARRPPAGAAVMVRHKGDLLLADDADELREKLAKRIQSHARRNQRSN